jgi:hypothetical protein
MIALTALGTSVHTTYSTSECCGGSRLFETRLGELATAQVLLTMPRNILNPVVETVLIRMLTQVTVCLAVMNGIRRVVCTTTMRANPPAPELNVGVQRSPGYSKDSHTATVTNGKRGDCQVFTNAQRDGDFNTATNTISR